MDDKLYYSDFKSDGDVEKLDSDADIRHVSDDLSEIYYLKDDTALLFRNRQGQSED